MTPETWTVFWKYVVYGSIGLYFVIALVVAVGGASDVGKLLQFLSHQAPEDQPPSSPSL
jgi:hypothetical protein